MTVYVDHARIPLGRMLMSHMFADTTEELLAMADTIGLDRKHLQNPGAENEHFDVAEGTRKKAIAAGAQEVTQRQLVKIIRERRRRIALGLPMGADDPLVEVGGVGATRHDPEQGDQTGFRQVGNFDAHDGEGPEDFEGDPDEVDFPTADDDDDDDDPAEPIDWDEDEK